MADPAEVALKVENMYRDMYIGEGKNSPPLMTRTSLLEDNMEKINKNLSKITWMLVLVLLTVIGEIVVKGVH